MVLKVGAGLTWSYMPSDIAEKQIETKVTQMELKIDN